MSTEEILDLNDLKEMLGEELTFANALMAERKSREMTKKDFSDLLGIGIQSLYDLEYGRKTPTPEYAAKIVKKLDFDTASWVELALSDKLRSRKY